jgi:hypothetical protein
MLEKNGQKSSPPDPPPLARRRAELLQHPLGDSDSEGRGGSEEESAVSM